MSPLMTLHSCDVHRRRESFCWVVSREGWSVMMFSTCIEGMQVTACPGPLPSNLRSA